MPIPLHTLPAPNVATAPLEFESIHKKHSLIFTLYPKYTNPASDGKANNPYCFYHEKCCDGESYCIRRYDLSLKMMIC